MDESTAQNQESQELKNLEEELKSLENPPQEQITPVPTSGTLPAVTTPVMPPQQLQETSSPVANSNPPPTTKSKGSKILAISIGFLVLSLIVAGAYFLGTKTIGQKTCTLEAKVCADGSSVGRVGPNCEFAACPTATPDPTASWTEYVNNIYGVSFRYPPGTKVLKCGGEPSNSPETFSGTADGTETSCVFLANAQNSLLGGISADFSNEKNPNQTLFDYMKIDKNSVVEKDVKGRTGYEIVIEATDQHLRYKELVIELSPTTTVSFIGDYDSEENINRTDQIFSTLKFIEAPQSLISPTASPKKTPTATPSATPQ